MTTTKYSFNLTRTLRVYQSMLRRYRGLGLLYGFLSFVALPLQYLLNMLSPNHIRPDSGLFGPSLAYNGVSAVLYFTLMFLMPLVLGIAMTEYMQQKRSVDVYHSLPVTREELLGGTAAAAVTILFIPLFLSFGLVMGMAGVNIGASAMGPLFQEALCWAACSFATLALTVFAAVNVGSSFDGTVFAIALNVIFTVISLINVGLADLFLYGYNGSERAVMFAVKLSPFSAMIARQTFSLGMTDFAEKLAENNLVCLLWFLAAVVFSLLSMHLYKKRKSEAAEVVGNYGALSLFIRAAGYYIVAVGMGAIFYGVLSRNDGEPFGYFTIGSLVGVLVAYLVIEVILSRGLKTVIRRLPVCLAAMLCMTVVSWGFHSGGFGFETRLPDPAKVRSVGISYTGRYDGAGSYKGQLTLENAESVAAVLQAHGALVAGRDDARGEEDRQDPYRYSNYVSLSLEYTMQNGSVMERRYYDRLPDEARQALASLEVNAEFIEQVHPVFGLDAKTIQGISIIDVLNTNSTYKELSAEDNQKLLEALRRDLQNATLESITHPEGPALGYIQIHYIREDLLQAIETTLPYPESPEKYTGTTYVLIGSDFAETIAFLRERGLYELIVADGSAIVEAQIFNALNDVSYRRSVVWQTAPDYFEQMVYAYSEKMGYGEPLTTADSEEIAYLLAHAVNSRLYDEKMCVMVFKTAEEKQGYAYFYIPQDQLPEGLKEKARSEQNNYYMY